MVRAVYISPTPAEARARALGLGFILDAAAGSPFVLIEGHGQSITIQEPTTKAAVAAALQPLLDLESAVAAAEQTRAGNADTLRSRAQTALAGNQTYLGLAALPAGSALTTTQLTTAVRALRSQVDALTRQNNALIRLILQQLDDTTGT